MQTLQLHRDESSSRGTTLIMDRFVHHLDIRITPDKDGRFSPALRISFY